jgi:hypothetical protein
MVVANTPISLYRQLSALSVVRRMSRECSPIELRDGFTEMTSRRRQSGSATGIAYAILVAAILTGQSHELNGEKLRWGKQIKSFAEPSVISTHVIPVAGTRVRYDNLSGPGQLLICQGQRR